LVSMILDFWIPWEVGRVSISWERCERRIEIEATRRTGLSSQLHFHRHLFPSVRPPILDDLSKLNPLYSFSYGNGALESLTVGDGN